MPNAHIEELLKTYQWHKLFELVKDAQYNPNISIEKQLDIALKAMLLSGWFLDKASSISLLAFFSDKIKNPLIYFCIIYSYISIGAVDKINILRKNKPKNLPSWIANWIDIEILGRSLKEEEQIKLVRKISKDKIQLDDYIKVAFLKSLEHSKVDITYLAQWIKDINLIHANDVLSQALCYRANILDCTTIKDDANPVLLVRKARYYKKERLIKNALLVYDELSKSSLINLKNMIDWLTISLSIPQGQEYFIQRINHAMQSTPNTITIRGTIASYAFIFFWINAKYIQAYNTVKDFQEYKNLPKDELIKMPQIFFSYMPYLCTHWQNNRSIYDNKLPNYKELNAFGESHSLSLSNINFTMNADNFHANSNFIMGIKMYHLSNPTSSYHAACLLEHFKFIKPNSDIMFTIGEIDTRPDEGIWQVHLKKEKAVDEIISDTVGGYIEFLYENLKDKNLSSVTIQGIPAPAYALEGDKDPKDKEGFLNMIKQVNEKLKELTLEKGWNFLDVYAATVGEDGKSNKKWHIDGYHLQPIFYTEADKWLVRV